MEEEEKYRIIRHQMWNKRRNDKKILCHTDVNYCVVVGRLDLDLNPLHLMTGNPLFTHAHWFVPYPYYQGRDWKNIWILKKAEYKINFQM